VHETTVESYARFDRNVWRVARVHCGLVADDLEFNQADQVAQVMGRRMFGSMVGGEAESFRAVGSLIKRANTSEVPFAKADPTRPTSAVAIRVRQERVGVDAFEADPEAPVARENSRERLKPNAE
jgi:hypothetical protein